MKRAYLLIILMLTSCITIGKQPSILDDSSCDAPCWNGITVGKTTKEETLDLLSELPILVPGSIAKIRPPGNLYDDRVNFFLYPNPIFRDLHGGYGHASFLGGKVVDLLLCGNIGGFGEVIARIAAPKSILVRPSPSGGFFVIAVNQETGLYFWYDTHNVPKRLSAQLAPDVQIDCLDYFEPDLYEEMLEIASFSGGHLNAEQTLEAMRPWVGYGDLDMYRP